MHYSTFENTCQSTLFLGITLKLLYKFSLQKQVTKAFRLVIIVYTNLVHYIPKEVVFSSVPFIMQGPIYANTIDGFSISFTQNYIDVDPIVNQS